MFARTKPEWVRSKIIMARIIDARLTQYKRLAKKRPFLIFLLHLPIPIDPLGRLIAPKANRILMPLNTNRHRGTFLYLLCQFGEYPEEYLVPCGTKLYLL
jgi:hypothetical protein